MFTVKIYDDETDLLEDVETFYTYNDAWNYAEEETDKETQYYIIKGN